MCRDSSSVQAATGETHRGLLVYMRVMNIINISVVPLLIGFR